VNATTLPTRLKPWLWGAAAALALAAVLMLYARPGFVFDLANRWLLCG
jgi:hypothetical protein